MSINLADYAELLEDLSPHSQETLRANWHEATKVFSPRGLDNYLKGAAAIRGLGRGDSLVETWIEQAPRVAKEVGEDVVADLATAPSPSPSRLMSINLADYAELLEDLSPHSQETLRANWHEATKVFSPRGLDNYLKGAAAIRGLGRGDSLVETWIEQAPRVAKEVGEDVVADLATAPSPSPSRLMSINLADYAELLEDLSPHSQETLRANWHEATKVFSPRGLDNYLKGAAAIRGLGRGDSLVETWIEQAPRVAKEVGEDVVADLATASLVLASKTSGAVIELLLASAPTAANRLGDAGLFLKYLQFINTLIAQAP
ncbi:MAG: hypothetical protein M1449_12575, partial [Candidatus Thermoplasmatota archaeon]|nr:hypothetical protein [Candidatus Thermoplasmatota archaeon]